MGMFDELICEIELPDKFVPDAGSPFQTKDLRCELDQYTLRADGRLRLTKKWTAKDNAVVPVDEPVDYSDWLQFYTYSGKRATGRVWHEYGASFVNGQLQGAITLLEVTSLDPPT